MAVAKDAASRSRELLRCVVVGLFALRERAKVMVAAKMWCALSDNLSGTSSMSLLRARLLIRLQGFNASKFDHCTSFCSLFHANINIDIAHQVAGRSMKQTTLSRKC